MPNRDNTYFNVIIDHVYTPKHSILWFRKHLDSHSHLTLPNHQQVAKGVHLLVWTQKSTMLT